MNYEEMLSSGNVQIAKGALLPIGFLHKKLREGKYDNVLDLRRHLSDSVLFAENVRRECEANGQLNSPYQLHFVIGETKDGEPKTLEVEKGRFTTFSRLLFESPSLVGRKDFLDEVINQLFDVAEYINKKGVRHLCYAPDNVLARVGDNKLLLLSHGSFYTNMSDQKAIYRDTADYVAPEVLGGGSVDERSDVYSIGKFIEWLYSTSDMPMEYKRVVKKATQELPEDRYQSVAGMRAALKRLKNMRGSAVMFLIALAAALVIVGVYFGMTPEPQEIEYVKPAPKQSTDDLLDDGFDPATELGVISGDSLSKLPAEKRKQMEEYQKKGEEIFRKQFEKEADRILSKIYDAEHMGASEKNFMASSQKVFGELMEMQQKLAGEANISNEKSQLIATQIIDKITEAKKKTVQKKGIQK
ncbi:MAG: hypothetical protein ACI4T5_04000 [Prevotella sp.]